jgi:hypothetical protein
MPARLAGPYDSTESNRIVDAEASCCSSSYLDVLEVVGVVRVEGEATLSGILVSISWRM